MRRMPEEIKRAIREYGTSFFAVNQSESIIKFVEEYLERQNHARKLAVEHRPHPIVNPR